MYKIQKYNYVLSLNRFKTAMVVYVYTLRLM